MQVPMNASGLKEDLSQKHRDRLLAYLPSELIDKFVYTVHEASIKSPEILQCTRSSIFATIFTCAELGLMPNTASGHAYLVPYKGILTFQIGYKGLIHLAGKEGFIISAYVVYKGEKFEYEQGTDGFIRHVPILNGRTDENIIASYAIAQKDKYKWFDILSREQIDKIKKASPSANSYSSPWKRWYGEMAKKSVVKRVLKMMPISPQLAKAVEEDSKGQIEKGEVDIHKGGIIKQYIELLEAKIQSATPDQKDDLLKQINNLSKQPAFPAKEILRLKNNLNNKFKD